MRVCLVAHRAYGAMVRETTGHIGGVERQTRLFAHWLRDTGHDVSVITWNEGGAPVEDIDGVRVIKLCAESDGLPGLRFFTPRWTSLTAALSEADADVYYHNCAEYVTGQIGFWCRKHNRRFVYSVASDYDVRRDAELHKPAKDEWFFAHGLKCADLIISQTRSQRALLQQNYGVEALVIPMPGTPPSPDPSISTRAKFDTQRVVWVGRVGPEKRVDWFIDVAQMLSSYHFEIMGPPGLPPDEMRAVEARINATENLSYLGKVPGDRMPARYQNAALLCCTSVFEGFPNTFLEAWSYSLPVVTTFDPDGLVTEHGLGVHGSSIDALACGINSMLSDYDRWALAGARANEYFETNHRLEQVMSRFENALTSVL